MLRPILSAINTGTHKWAKFVLRKPFTSNNYTVKDFFDFAKDITQQSSNFYSFPWCGFPFHKSATSSNY